MSHFLEKNKLNNLFNLSCGVNDLDNIINRFNNCDSDIKSRHYDNGLRGD